jgi:hypothetical protein
MLIASGADMAHGGRDLDLTAEEISDPNPPNKYSSIQEVHYPWKHIFPSVKEIHVHKT